MSGRDIAPATSAADAEARATGAQGPVGNPSRRRLLRGLPAVPLAAWMTARPASATAPAPGPAPASAPAAAAALLGADVATRHSTGAGAAKFDYTAIYSETALRDAAGKLQATISSTSYLKEGGAGAQRPVVFLYNGGPGSSSSMLQFGGLGPRRIVGKEGAPLQMVDNAYTLLADADLVFVDPVGTGFNQVPAGGDGQAYWGADGDAKVAVELVRAWLAKHGRAASPVYLCGESYGGYRLAMMSKFTKDLPLAGMLLISPLLDMSGRSDSPGNDQPYVINLPSMSAAAWYHGRIARNGRSAEQVFDEATRYAQGEYAAALQLGRRLPAADAGRIAARLSALIGLPEKTILDAKLRVPGEDFMLALLNDPERRIGSLDTRVTGWSKRPRTPAQPTTDPSFPSYGQAGIIAEYYQRELQVPIARPYVTLTLDVNRAWKYRDPKEDHAWYMDGTVQVTEAMLQHPKMRVMVMGGYFDMSIPYLGSVYSVDHAGMPAERVRLAPLVSGHSPYDDEPTLRSFAEQIRSFVIQT